MLGVICMIRSYTFVVDQKAVWNVARVAVIAAFVDRSQIMTSDKGKLGAETTDAVINRPGYGMMHATEPRSLAVHFQHHRHDQVENSSSCGLGPGSRGYGDLCAVTCELSEIIS